MYYIKINTKENAFGLTPNRNSSPSNHLASPCTCLKRETSFEGMLKSIYIIPSFHTIAKQKGEHLFCVFEGQIIVKFDFHSYILLF
ncbi:hypothetical protein D5F11_004505 [Siminovitchia terrae]|uniref:Uncharacterized protein n=1 Tax=Siminovitchia terrae TaxID=1914933 RepID=A0A429XBF0_SIMTE|nr:hypothetical protein D5F11_004505 [Siminovitchia terrae]